ncbi:MAG: dethiobiotin synthase [Bacteroidota bacterium]|nr:dethiobiotin synthase [Bacteroidota bacterium]
MNYCIAGIHTGIGKTVCSAIICQALGYDYWKPVQAGDLDNSDSIFIKNNVSNPLCNIHAERFKLLTPASPHYAAELENIQIKKEDFSLPATWNNLIVETAGGLLSPLSDNFLNIDLIEHLRLPVVLVSNNYLGSINHTLLSYNALKDKNIPVSGIVFVGEKVVSSERFILKYTRLPKLFSIPVLTSLNKQSIGEFVLKNDIKLSNNE